MRCHDAAHVIFGCDTTLPGEATVKIWTTFGTTMTQSQVAGACQEASAVHVFQEYSIGHFIKLQQGAVVRKTLGLTYQVNERLNYHLGVMWIPDLTNKYNTKNLTLRKQIITFNLGASYNLR